MLTIDDPAEPLDHLGDQAFRCQRVAEIGLQEE